MNPLISIVMPVFNCETTLPLAVRSIREQTFTDWELLILDDGSSDRSVEVARSFNDSRIRVFADDALNLGLSERLNQGIRLSGGRYIARMDGDDVSFPQRLEKQIRFLVDHSDIDLVGCGMVIFNDAGELVGVQNARRTHREICGNVLRSCLLPHATWMGRAEWFQNNAYDPSHRRAEDRELLLRTRDVSRFAGMSNAMYGYRVNRVSIRKNTRARFEYLKAVLADAIARRQWFRFMGAGAAEISKAIIDTFAFATRTDGLLLRHRSRAPKDRAVITTWQSVWNALHQPSAGKC